MLSFYGVRGQYTMSYVWGKHFDCFVGFKSKNRLALILVKWRRRRRERRRRKLEGNIYCNLAVSRASPMNNPNMQYKVI